MREACPRAYVALKPTAPGFKYATDRDLIAPEVPVTFFLVEMLPNLRNSRPGFQFENPVLSTSSAIRSVNSALLRLVACFEDPRWSFTCGRLCRMVLPRLKVPLRGCRWHYWRVERRLLCWLRSLG